MFSLKAEVVPGTVSVDVVNGRTRTPEEWAELAVKRIIHCAEGTHPAIRDQANDYRTQIKALVAHYIREAVAEERMRKGTA